MADEGASDLVAPTRSLLLFAAALAAAMAFAVWVAQPLQGQAPTVPQDPTPGRGAAFAAATVGFILLSVVAAALLVWAVRRGRVRALRVVLLAAVAVILAVALVRPIAWLTPHTGPDLAWALGIAAAGLAVWAWDRTRAWWLQDAVAVAVAAGAAAVVGTVLGVAPLLVLLVAMAAFDHYAVHRSGHMLNLASATERLRLPLLITDTDRQVAHGDELGSRQQAAPAPDAPAPSGGATHPRDPASSAPAPASTARGKTGAPALAKRPRPGGRNNGAGRRAAPDGGLMMGIGDLLFPASLVVAAADPTRPWGALPAVMCAAGAMAGYAFLAVRIRHHPVQAGLPPLTAGAILGLFAGAWAATGSLRWW